MKTAFYPAHTQCKGSKAPTQLCGFYDDRQSSWCDEHNSADRKEVESITALARPQRRVFLGVSLLPKSPI